MNFSTVMELTHDSISITVTDYKLKSPNDMDMKMVIAFDLFTHVSRELMVGHESGSEDRR